MGEESDSPSGYDTRQWLIGAASSLMVLYLGRIVWLALMLHSTPHPGGLLHDLNWGHYLLMHIMRLLWIVALLHASSTFGGHYYNLDWGVYSMMALDLVRSQLFAVTLYAAVAESRRMLVAWALLHTVLGSVDVAVTGAFVFVMYKLGRSFAEWAITLLWLLLAIAFHAILVVMLIRKYFEEQPVE